MGDLMKKHIKLTIFIIALFVVYFIYGLFINQNSKMIYIPLGDSIAEGMNPYHDIEYSYTDYVADYLKKEDNLSFYTKKFSKSGYTINDVKRDIEDNKVIEIDNKKYYLKEVLRESDLVTLTIGANDFIKGMSIDDIPVKLMNMKEVKKEADSITNNLKDLLQLIKKYAKNQIIVTGYFNPLPRMTLFKDSIDEVVRYYNNLVEEICDELNIKYVDIFDVLDKRSDVFSNPLDIHPDKKGYEIISKEIIKNIE